MFNKVSVLVDNDSWILPYATKLVESLKVEGIKCKLYRKHNDVASGDICFMLGCTKIVKDEVLKKNRFNLVIHESDLPKGKGFAPVAWQIIEGMDSIPVCLIEAGSNVDSGDIWLKDVIKLDGTELCNEWRAKQGEISIKLALKFVANFLELKNQKQEGAPSFYARRTPNDSELDIDKSINEQFSLLRTVDNVNYPAFFYRNGIKYKLLIEKEGN